MFPVFMHKNDICGIFCVICVNHTNVDQFDPILRDGVQGNGDVFKLMMLVDGFLVVLEFALLEDLKNTIKVNLTQTNSNTQLASTRLTSLVPSWKSVSKFSRLG